MIVILAAVIASALTLFSGFGLGTLLLPAFLFVAPAPVAVAMTAIVHLAANVAKLVLVGRHADVRVLVAFGVPALIAAFAGAWLLDAAGGLPVIATYSLGTRVFSVTWMKVVVGVVIIGFALLDLAPLLRAGEPDATRREQERGVPSGAWLPIGGVLSGFFGGLTGHQGALRSLFLTRLRLSKEAFVGTGVVIACAVDVTRLGVYWAHLDHAQVAARWQLLLAGCIAGIAGAYLGVWLLKKVTVSAVQVVVACGLALFGAAMAAGLI